MMSPPSGFGSLSCACADPNSVNRFSGLGVGWRTRGPESTKNPTAATPASDRSLDRSLILLRRWLEVQDFHFHRLGAIVQNRFDANGGVRGCAGLSGIRGDEKSVR